VALQVEAFANNQVLADLSHRIRVQMRDAASYKEMSAPAKFKYLFEEHFQYHKTLPDLLKDWYRGEPEQIELLTQAIKKNFDEESLSPLFERSVSHVLANNDDAQNFFKLKAYKRALTIVEAMEYSYLNGEVLEDNPKVADNMAKVHKDLKRFIKGSIKEVQKSLPENPPQYNIDYSPI
jgi:hypothetical protein